MIDGVPLDSLGRRIARHPRSQKASDDQLRVAYEELGNVWKVAERFGMCGQSVHERLTKLGVVEPMNVFAEHEKDRLRRDYELFAGRGRLHVLAAQMGRTKHFICRQARELGLTDIRRPKPYISAATSARFRKWHEANEHPRGMLGKKHSEATKEVISQHSFDRWHGMTKAQREAHSTKAAQAAIAKHGKIGDPANRASASWKAGWREIADKRHYFRSRWEANYARYLQWLKEKGEILEWEYEPETFWFEAIKRGVRSYLPDFRVHELSGARPIHEVKGWMDARSKTTLKRMAKYHPQETIILICAKEYKLIGRAVGRLIEGWEA